MERRSLSIPEIAIIAGTRGALGAGLGLLLGDFLSREQRRAVGWSLLGVGLVSTIPIAVQLFNPKSKEEAAESLEKQRVAGRAREIVRSVA